jgi:hypothetical protein
MRWRSIGPVNMAGRITDVEGDPKNPKVFYVTGATGCSDPQNFAIATDAAVKVYQDLATTYAIADRYFQPISGQSSSNDMYFAVAKEVFVDNAANPPTVASNCSLTPTAPARTGETTIADLLQAAGKTVTWYAEGYADAVKAGSGCAKAPTDCAFYIATYPCIYDPGDVPFLYYAQFANNEAKFMRDYGEFAKDLAAGTLPDVSFVKAVGYHTEHPGYGTNIDFNPGGTNSLSNITIRRNIVTKSWDATAVHSQGMFLANLNTVLLDEIDRSAANPCVPGQIVAERGSHPAGAVSRRQPPPPVRVAAISVEESPERLSTMATRPSATRSSRPAACTSSAPAGTTPAASTTSCAAGPDARATRAARCSSSAPTTTWWSRTTSPSRAARTWRA